MQRVDKSPPKKKSSYSREQILIDDEYYDALYVDLQQAIETIDISTYIFSHDRVGKVIIRTLEKAVNRGVKVRLLIDGVGSRNCDASLIKMLITKGIEVKVYHPLPWKLWQWGSSVHIPTHYLTKFYYLLTKINTRNHRKLCIIDKKIAYISSANLDQVHLSTKRGGKGWHDISVRITEKNFSFLIEIFNLAWNHISFKQKLRNKFRKMRMSRYFATDSNRKIRRKHYRELLARIDSSKDRIWIINAYFVPDSYLMKALIKAAKRNVDIRILLPRESDVLISTLVANTFYGALLKNNISIYEYIKSVLHAKAMIIDQWYRIGSSNLNSRSIKHDLELDVMLETKFAKKILEQQFIIDMNCSEKIDLIDLKKQSIFKTILGRILLFIRHWL